MPPEDYDHPDDSTGHERNTPDVIKWLEQEEAAKDDMARLIYAALRALGEVNVRVRDTEHVFTLAVEAQYGLRQYEVVDGGIRKGWMLLNKADALEWFRELEMIVEF